MEDQETASVHRFSGLSITGNRPPNDAAAVFVVPFICLKVTLFSDLNTLISNWADLGALLHQGSGAEAFDYSIQFSGTVQPTVVRMKFAALYSAFSLLIQGYSAFRSVEISIHWAAQVTLLNGFVKSNRFWNSGLLIFRST